MKKDSSYTTPTIRIKERQAYVMLRRREGIPFEQIADELGITYSLTYTAYKKALREIIQEPTEDVIRLELDRLDMMYQAAVKVLQGFHPIVNSGQIVRDVVEDENGNVVIDPATGTPKTYRLEDVAPKLAAIDRGLKIMERRAKMLGLDKIKAPDPDKAGMTAEEFASEIIRATNKMDESTRAEAGAGA